MRFTSVLCSKPVPHKETLNEDFAVFTFVVYYSLPFDSLQHLIVFA
jgi:hypothetical protein